MKFLNRDRITGFLIYPFGDAVGQWIAGDFNGYRFVVMSLVGGLIYAYEIPKYFEWIDRKPWGPLPRIVAAMAYFNPLWIARHLFFIKIAYEPHAILDSAVLVPMLYNCLSLGVKSFVGGIVFSIIGNYIIQIRLKLDDRFFASSIFNAFMIIYYALTELFFQK